mgnify:CR=1 FL=1
MMNYSTVYFYEDQYCVRSIVDEEEKLKAYQLRHEVFCQSLEWVPPNPNGLETDGYDPFSMLLGVFSTQEELLGTFRVLPSDRTFMLESEFASLIAPDYRVRKDADTAEITRFTTAPGLWERGISPAQISKLLYKGMYQWSLVNCVRFLYVVVEKRFWRALVISGYPYEPIGPIKALPPAEAESVAAILDWEKFRLQNKAKRATFLNWMMTLQPDLVPWPEQWHGLGSRNAVFPKYYARETSPSVR